MKKSTRIAAFFRPRRESSGRGQLRRRKPAAAGDRRRGRSGFLALGLVLVLAGCVRVQPWERDYLSKRSMSFTSETEENVLDHTFYSAHEGAAGGFEAGGGGCGCK